MNLIPNCYFKPAFHPLRQQPYSTLPVLSLLSPYAINLFSLLLLKQNFFIKGYHYEDKLIKFLETDKALKNVIFVRNVWENLPH